MAARVPPGTPSARSDSATFTGSGDFTLERLRRVSYGPFELLRGATLRMAADLARAVQPTIYPLFSCGGRVFGSTAAASSGRCRSRGREITLRLHLGDRGEVPPGGVTDRGQTGAFGTVATVEAAALRICEPDLVIHGPHDVVDEAGALLAIQGSGHPAHPARGIINESGGF